MPVRYGAPNGEFRYASYMVEAVYRPTQGGVWLAMTNPESNNAGGYPDLWDVYFLPQALVVDVQPYRYIPEGLAAQYMGRFGDVWPEIRNRRRYPTMASYCQGNYVNQWYRHWCGFSQQYQTLDERWYALDVYWQPPRLLYREEWIWYVMMDQNEPNQYWQGRILYFNGIRNMGIDNSFHWSRM